jgi:hypothetical protein
MDLHVPGREHVLSHRSWNKRLAAALLSSRLSAVQCIAQTSGRFGRFDSRSLKQGAHDDLMVVVDALGFND